MASRRERFLGSASTVALGLVLTGCGSSQPAPLLTKSVTIGNGLQFDCIQTPACVADGALQTTENVLMIHGFPERKEFYSALMNRLPAGFCGSACDMHGYSPGASPDDMMYWLYDNLRKDSFEIATKLGYGDFHLVAHDHGALLGWHMVGSDILIDRQRIISFTSLASPHTDAASEAIGGGGDDVLWQKVASQYFTSFVLPNSASLHDNYWFNRLKCSWDRCFETPDDLQKALWWYNGLFAANYPSGTDKATAKLTMPGYMSAQEILATDFPNKAYVAEFAAVFSNDTGAGWPQVDKVGTINTPTLFVCGAQDTSILCTQDWAKATQQYCKGGYTYQVVECGHNLAKCEKDSQTKAVQDHILAHLENNLRSARSSNQLFA